MYNPLNYRGISLLSNIGKCFSSFINNRIVRYCNMLDLIHDEQNGFRARRSCTDHIFVLNSIIKNNLAKSKSVFCAFVDMEKCFDRIDRNLLLYKLLEFNIDGKLYWCIKSFYENNLSCIRLSPSITTEWFDVTCGVRQGDPLSATLFNIFINDLILLIKNLNVGVQISDNLNISILLYADDIVLLAENEVNLQLMLSTLEKWCRDWKLDVNLKKSNVIHFRKKNLPETLFKFKYKQNEMLKTHEYKYLGILFNEFGNLDSAVELLADSASRALGVIISKYKILKNVRFHSFTRMYNAGVIPILQYGAEIWGFGKYSPPDKIHHRAMRFLLGVHRFTPVPALYGDTGWLKPRESRYLCLFNYWNKLVNMREDRLTKCIFNWDYLQCNVNNWSSDMKNLCEQLELDFYESKQPVSTLLVKSKINNLHQNNWLNDVNMKPKLRTYKLFKEIAEIEPYIASNLPRYQRSLLAQLRFGILPLSIETGRAQKKKVEERICPLCSDGVEDETHFICICEYYKLQRDELFNQILITHPNFNNLTNIDKLAFLMKYEWKTLMQYLSLIWNIRKEKLYVAS